MNHPRVSGISLQVCLLLCAAIGRAQPAAEKKLDIATFTAPAGWTVTERAGVVSFAHIDANRGVYCVLGVYESRPSTGDAERDFAREWKEVIQKSLGGERVPESKDATGAGGLHYREGGVNVSVGGRPSYARLLTIQAGPRVMSVMVLTSNEAALESYRQPLETFLKSLRVAVKDEGRFRGGGIAGVWMGFSDLESDQNNWVVLFDDGQVFQNIPTHGLLGFDRKASKADKYQHNLWGTYTFRDGLGRIEKPEVIRPIRISDVKDGQMRLDGSPYSRCADVNALRLEGAWTSASKPDDPDVQKMAAGRRTIFRFRKDGSFTDEGVFAVFGVLLTGEAGHTDAEDKAGSGTYEIKDFTLVLKYSDGRVKTLSVTGYLGADPAVDDKVLFLSRVRFRKMR